MTSLREAFRQLFAPIQPLPSGVYHYQSPPDTSAHYRLHLRLEPDGKGLLIVNAATILHLNQTAAEYAYHLVHSTPESDAAKQISNRYRIHRQVALEDYRNFAVRIRTLVETPDLDPEMFLDFERTSPHTSHLGAPLRLDCALTYRLPIEADGELAPTKRVDQELSTDNWKQIINKAYNAGIPHIVFTGGEPTMRQDLAELIAYAESNGQVTGLLSDGLAFTQKEILIEMLQKGLDHLMLLLQPHNEESWKGLENALAEDIYLAVHLTVTLDNALEMPDLIRRLAEIGVKAISLSTADSALHNRLSELRDSAASHGLSLVWDLPVPYSSFNPVALETHDDGVSQGAGHTWLYIEPDGDVLPAQGINRVLGNILRDPWESIWQPS